MAESDGDSSHRLRAAEYERLATTAARELFPDYDEAAMAMCFNLIRAGNRVMKDLEVSVHRPQGLSFAAYRLLFAIRSVGPVNPNELARLSSVSTASTSSLLNTLERYDLVARRPDSTDKRRTVVDITPAGRDKLAELVRLNNERESAWAGGLTETEASILALLLRKVLQHHPGATRS